MKVRIKLTSNKDWKYNKRNDISDIKIVMSNALSFLKCV